MTQPASQPVDHTPLAQRGTRLPDDDVLDRLRGHRLLGTAPLPELEWLAAHGQLRHYRAGEVTVHPSLPIIDLVVIFSGAMCIYLDRGSGRRKVLEWRDGDVSGLLPYSRMQHSPGEGIIEEDSDLFLVSRDHFPEMIRECPTVTASLVHNMLDRARFFTSTDMQDEKMMSLGRLAAGLAHELNNPASAAARSAELLTDALANADKAAHALGAVHMTAEQQAVVDGLRLRCLAASPTTQASPIERADQEDALTTWLEAHGLDATCAIPLADAGVGVTALDELAATLNAPQLDAAIRWIAAESTTRALATEISRATRRIHDLVSSVKRFTYMDRATVSEPANIAGGLHDTIAVLASKARAKSVEVSVDVPQTLPEVRAFGGELNQVWSNLLENALDAVAERGRVTVRVAVESDRVVVRVTDNGSGIPDEVKPRIFDPFFTTKPIGHGTGLGLDISRRIVRAHHGEIAFDSRPGCTEFRVALPIARRSSAFTAVTSLAPAAASVT